MRIALSTVVLSLALAGGLFTEARAEGVRLSASGVRVAADAMAVRGQVCVQKTAETVEPNLTLQVLDRSGSVVGVLPVELDAKAASADGCATYAMDVQIRLSETARICIVSEGQQPEDSIACAPRMRG
jgi:hypothetical protein